MTKWRRVIKASIAAALVLSIAAAPAAFGLRYATASAASSSELQQTINDLEEQQADLESQQAEVAEKLASLKEDEANQLEYKQTLDDQLVSIQEEINVINKKIKALDKKIKEKQAEIEEDEIVITDTFSQLKERIRALYLAGEASTLEILLNSESIADFADKAEVLRSITAHDSALIDTLKEELAKVKEQKAEIEESRQEVADARSELEEKEAEVTDLLDESVAVLEQIQASKEEANSLADELEAEFDATSDELEQIYNDYYAALSKEEQAARKKAASSVVTVNDDNYNPDYEVSDSSSDSDSDSDSSSGGSSSGSSSGSSGSATASGQFIWPAPGTTVITSGVGPRWGRSHNGIDISGGNAYGSPIVASDSGTVIVANKSGWGGGYGLYVMIDHGNGYTTVYGHASSVIVDVGQTVSQGQTIAYIGSTGNSTGPHLHFEIRLNGSILDPENYVSP